MFTEKISLSVEPGQMAIDPLLSVTPIPSETRCGSRVPLPQNSASGTVARRKRDLQGGPLRSELWSVVPESSEAPPLLSCIAQL